jgi:chromosome segregation ATPase
MNDLEKLNSQLEVLTGKFDTSVKEKEQMHGKVVSLENDNDFYAKKIRQLEAANQDLKAKYENVMEELISNKTEFNEYKEKTNDIIEKMKKELNDKKNEKECNNGHNGDNKNVLKATGKGLKNETLKDLIGKMKKRRKELEEFQLNVKNFIPEQKKKAS